MLPNSTRKRIEVAKSLAEKFQICVQCKNTRARKKELTDRKKWLLSFLVCPIPNKKTDIFLAK